MSTYLHSCGGLLEGVERLWIGTQLALRSCVVFVLFSGCGGRPRESKQPKQAQLDFVGVWLDLCD